MTDRVEGFELRPCICADPENCREPALGYVCRKGMTDRVEGEPSARIAELERQIAEAREACPSVRQDRFADADLLTVVNEEVSLSFRYQSRAEGAETALADARRVLNADLKTASERVLTLELENQQLNRELAACRAMIRRFRDAVGADDDQLDDAVVTQINAPPQITCGLCRGDGADRDDPGLWCAACKGTGWLAATGAAE